MATIPGPSMQRILLNLWVSVLLLPCCSYGQSAKYKQVDSAVKKAATIRDNDTAYMSTCFFIADVYMDLNMYDSAQSWLNEIAVRVPLRKPTLFTFYLSINQAITW
jgi:hypothetical protein